MDGLYANADAEDATATQAIVHQPGTRVALPCDRCVAHDRLRTVVLGAKESAQHPGRVARVKRRRWLLGHYNIVAGEGVLHAARIGTSPCDETHTGSRQRVFRVHMPPRPPAHLPLGMMHSRAFSCAATLTSSE